MKLRIAVSPRAPAAGAPQDEGRPCKEENAGCREHGERPPGSRRFLHRVRGDRLRRDRLEVARIDHGQLLGSVEHRQPGVSRAQPEAQVVEVLPPGEQLEVDAVRLPVHRVERVDEGLLARAVVERVGPAPVRGRLARDRETGHALVWLALVDDRRRQELPAGDIEGTDLVPGRVPARQVVDEEQARPVRRQRVEAEVALEDDVASHAQVLRVQDDEARPGAREAAARVDEHERRAVGRKAGRGVVESDDGDGVAAVEKARHVDRFADSGDDGAALGGQGDQAAAHLVPADDGGRAGVGDREAVRVGKRREDEGNESCDDKSSAHAATTPAERKRVPGARGGRSGGRSRRARY